MNRDLWEIDTEHPIKDLGKFKTFGLSTDRFVIDTRKTP